MKELDLPQDSAPEVPVAFVVRVAGRRKLVIRTKV